jgi:hypothetical protein
MPALAKSKVGSLRGTQGEEGMNGCGEVGSEAKWEMKVERILEVGHAVLLSEVVSTSSSWADDSRDEASLEAAELDWTEKARQAARR